MASDSISIDGQYIIAAAQWIASGVLAAGGLAVLIVKWMMGRLDKQTDALIGSVEQMRQSNAQWQQFAAEMRAHNERVLDKLERLEVERKVA